MHLSHQKSYCVKAVLMLKNIVQNRNEHEVTRSNLQMVPVVLAILQRVLGFGLNSQTFLARFLRSNLK